MHLDTVENRKCMGQAIETSADREPGLLEREIQTWGNTGKRFWGLIIERIMTSLKARIALEGGNRVERAAGYSNDDNVLRLEFGIDLEPEVSESTAGHCTDLRKQHGQREPQRNQEVDLAGVAEADTPLQARGTDQEDEEENCYITTL